MNIKHQYQPTGNSCGPTCISMVHEFLNEEKISVETISEICGTDWIVGTPPDRMEIGFKKLNINYLHHIAPLNVYAFLRSILDKGNIPILRTITKNVPHWIIVSNYYVYNDENHYRYAILDPWQGNIQYTQEELNNVWMPRYYEFFEIVTNGN